MRNCRSASTLAAGALLAVALGCGSATSPQRSGRSAPIAGLSSAPHGYLHEDDDRDGDEGPGSPNPGQDDEDLLSGYRRAPPAAAHAIVALVRDYYAASLAAQGGRACALLSRALAGGLAGSGEARAPASSCARAMYTLLSQQHSHLAAEEPATMTAASVYVRGTQGLAVLGFRRAPESELLVVREGGAWKVDALFDSEMP